MGYVYTAQVPLPFFNMLQLDNWIFKEDSVIFFIAIHKFFSVLTEGIFSAKLEEKLPWKSVIVPLVILNQILYKMISKSS